MPWWENWNPPAADTTTTTPPIKWPAGVALPPWLQDTNAARPPDFVNYTPPPAPVRPADTYVSEEGGGAPAHRTPGTDMFGGKRDFFDVTTNSWRPIPWFFDYKTPTQDMNLPGTYAAQDYEPTFWEDPRRVARYYMGIQNLPAGTELPPWVDMPTLEATFNYLRTKNNNRPWYTWDFPAADDPVREVMQQLPLPPAGSDPESKGYWDKIRTNAATQLNAYIDENGLVTPNEAPQTGADTTMGMPTSVWEKLPWYNKWLTAIIPENARATIWNPNTPDYQRNLAIAGGVGNTALGAFMGIPLGPAGMVAGAGFNIAGLNTSEIYNYLINKKWTPENAQKLVGGINWTAGAFMAAPRLASQTIGLMAQIGHAIEDKDPDTLKEIFGNLNASWQAGALMYPASSLEQNVTGVLGNIVNQLKDKITPEEAQAITDLSNQWSFDKALALTGLLGSKYGVDIGAAISQSQKDIASGKVFNVWDLGNPEMRTFQTPTHEAATDWAMNEARKRLINAPQTGETLDQISYDIGRQFGYPGEMRTLIGMIVLNPAMLQGKIETAGVRFFAESIGNKPLINAATIAGNTNEMLRLYRSNLRALPVEEAAGYGGLSKFIAGLTKEGKVWNPAEDGKILGFFGLTPEARANELNSQLTDAIGVLYERSGRNVAKLKSFVKAISEMTPEEAVKNAAMLEEYGIPKWFNSTEAATIPQAMKQILPMIDALFEVRALNETNRAEITKLAAALGMKPEEMIRDFNDGVLTGEKLIKRLSANPETAKVVAKSDPAAIDKMVSPFTKKFGGKDFQSFTDDQFVVEILHGMEYEASKYYATYTGVKTPGWVYRLADLGKRMQSKLLLGLNPMYPLNNTLDNISKLSWDGLLKLGGSRAYQDVIPDFGMTPSSFAKGLGPGAAGELGTFNMGEGIRSALRAGDKDIIQRAQDKVGRGILGKTTDAMVRLSGWLEGRASEVAIAKGLMEYMDRAWKGGIGFDPMSREYATLAQALDSIHPGLSKRIEQGIARHWTYEKFQNTILQDLGQRSVLDFFNQSDRSLLRETFGSLMDSLDAELKTAKTDEQIQTAFKNAKAKVMDNLLAEQREKITDYVGQVVEKVKKEGYTGAWDEFDAIVHQHTEYQLQQAKYWDEVVQRASGKSRAQKQQIWNDAFIEADKGWQFYENGENARWLGLVKGLGDGDQASLFNNNLLKIQQIERAFYEKRMAAYKEHFAIDFGNDAEAARAAWLKLSDELDAGWAQVMKERTPLVAENDGIFADLFANQFKEPGARDQALAWRAKVNTENNLRNESIRYFRNGKGTLATAKQGTREAALKSHIDTILKGKKLNDLMPEERDLAWDAFSKEVDRPLVAESMKASNSHDASLMTPTPEPLVYQVGQTFDLNDGVASRTVRVKQAGNGADGKAYYILEYQSALGAWIPYSEAKSQAQIEAGIQNLPKSGEAMVDILGLGEEKGAAPTEKPTATAPKPEETSGKGATTTAETPPVETVPFEQLTPERKVMALRDIGKAEDVTGKVFENTLNKYVPGFKEKSAAQGYENALAELTPEQVRQALVEHRATASKHKASAAKKENAEAAARIENFITTGDIISSPEFKTWFGESKIVGEGGEPRTVYHGTTSDFTGFDLSQAGKTDEGFYGKGIYFSSSPEVAGNYAETFNEVKPKIVIPAYLRIEKPVRIDFSADRTYNYAKELSQYLPPKTRMSGGLEVDTSTLSDKGLFDRYSGEQLGNAILQAGYDGVIIKYAGDDYEYVVFDPNQVKSKFNRNPSRQTNDLIEPVAKIEETLPPVPEMKSPEVRLLQREILTLQKYYKNINFGKLFSLDDALEFGKDYWIIHEMETRRIHKKAEIIAAVAEARRKRGAQPIEEVKPIETTTPPETETAKSAETVAQPSTEDRPATPETVQSKITWTETIDSRTPEQKAFASDLPTKIMQDRPAVIQQAEQLSGKHIVDLGNFNEGELEFALTALIAPLAKETIPGDTNYVILSHGEGTGTNWRVKGTNKTIQSVVDENVPAGEKAYVIACETGKNRNIATLEGVEVVSRGKTVAPETPTETEAVRALQGTVDRTNAMPMTDATYEGLLNDVLPALEKAQRRYMSDEGRDYAPVGINDLPPETARQLMEYIRKQYDTKLGDTKIAAMKWADARRNFALLDYTRTHGYDRLANIAFPYQFWYTRSALNWAIRALTQSWIISDYLYLRNFHQTDEDKGYPSRLKGKVGIPIPFQETDKWMGDGIFVDPSRQVFGFEQMLSPFKTAVRQENMLSNKAMSNVQERLRNEEITQAQADLAINSRMGDIWDKAYDEAVNETDLNITSPLDFATSLVGLSLPLEYLRRILLKQTDRISQLPITRFIQANTAAFGIGGPRGINIEAPIRKAVGLPEVDRFEDSKTTQQLAYMAMDGEVKADEAMKALIDRKGPVYEAAQQRVSKIGFSKYWLASFLADFFPEGEQTARIQQDEYYKLGEAIQNGDTKAFTKFYQEHPEYEVYQAIWKDPQEVFKRVVINQVWKRYLALPDLQKKYVREQFGDQFTINFLNKQTQSYDTITPQTLTQWAQMLPPVPGMADLPETMPGAKGTAATPVTTTAGVTALKMAPAEDAKAMQAYNDAKDKKFPGIAKIQTLLYGLPENQQETYRKKYPQVAEYSKWNNAYLASHPGLLKYTITEQNELYGLPQEVQIQVYKFRAQKDQMFPTLDKLQEEYFAIPDGKLSNVAYEQTAYQKRTNQPLKYQSAKSVYLQQHPELKVYWDWRTQYAAQFPKAAPYILSDATLSNAILGNQGGSTGGDSTYGGGSSYTPYQGTGGGGQKGPDKLSAGELRMFSLPLTRQLFAYFYGNGMGKGGWEEINRIWEALGKPGGTLESWLQNTVKASFRQ
jgi:hypothetical protein